jgi:flagellar biosynthesis/type III secretory pathway protein FliH
MRHDGPKQLGRFIKKDSSVMKKVVLEEFRFSEINPLATIDQDNSRRSIVHAKYHPEEELNEAVRKPKKFEDDLAHPDSRRPIIFPVDFTGDWEREKKMRKDRNQRSDEDDDFNYGADSGYESKSTASGYDLTQHSENDSHKELRKDPTVKSRDDSDEESEITRLHTPLKIAGPAIKEFSQNSIDDKLGKNFSIGAVQASHQSAAPLNMELAMNPKPAPAPVQAPLVMPDNLDTQGNFIASGPGASDNIHDPEQNAAELYRQRVAQEKIDQEKIQALYEEAKAKGFEDGFRAGEEKGELQVRQSASTLFQKVHSLVESFMELKGTVLENVQENFYTVSQAVAEALLKREFKINPESFATVVRKAIEDAVAPNDFKIRVHPKMADKLSGIADKQFLKSIIKDPSVEDGDFKIESNLTMVDVNITKLVSDLIDQTDISLFDAVEKVG